MGEKNLFGCLNELLAICVRGPLKLKIPESGYPLLSI